MKKTFSVVALTAIMVLIVALFSIGVATAQETGNQVTFYLDHWYYCLEFA
jgi:hypothetical protein